MGGIPPYVVSQDKVWVQVEIYLCGIIAVYISAG